MEKVPSPESSPIDRGTVSVLLKEKGFEDLEAKDLLNRWLDQNQQKVERGEATNLEFNISWAELYRAADMNEAALESFEQAANLATQENDAEALKRIRAEIDKFSS